MSKKNTNHKSFVNEQLKKKLAIYSHFVMTFQREMLWHAVPTYVYFTDF